MGLTPLIISILFGVALSALILLYQQRIKVTDWSVRKGKQNLGGYYHDFFMCVQAMIILYGLLVIHSLPLIISISGHCAVAVIVYITTGEL